MKNRFLNIASVINNRVFLVYPAVLKCFHTGVCERASYSHFLNLQEKALKFFNITGQTMESFVKSLDGDVRELDSDENQFVFALAGIVTSK